MEKRRRNGSATRIRPGTICVLISLLTVFGTGCQLAYFLSPEYTKETKAEYGKIGDRKVAVIVWADQSTLDMDRYARRRVCKAVTYYLRKHLPDARFVSPRKVTDLQRRPGSEWEGMSSAALCKELDCDLVLRIDLLEYTTRAGDTRELRKGRVRATVCLYDGDPEVLRDALYETEIVTTFPPDSIHGVPDIEDGDLLHESVEHFAHVTARKFYDHEVSLRGPARP